VKFVTIAMIAAHVGRTKQAVGIAMRLAGVKTERAKGLKGVRILLRDANTFIGRQWPESSPMGATANTTEP